jgi:hypothetical protein
MQIEHEAEQECRIGRSDRCEEFGRKLAQRLTRRRYVITDQSDDVARLLGRRWAWSAVIEETL